MSALTPAERERLAKLNEELGESMERMGAFIQAAGKTNQAISKTLLHGYEIEAHGVVYPNREDLMRELGDVQAAVDLMVDSGDVSRAKINEYRKIKRPKITRYMDYQPNLAERPLEDYPVRICVAGSRSFHNQQMFDAVLKAYLSWAGVDPYAFISGDAWRGPDRMIIEWAEAHNVPCFKFPADWDAHGKAAGYIRNGEMRKRLTHLLVFWDGVSTGTKEMIENTRKLENVHVFVVYVKPDPEWIERQQQKAASDAQYSKQRFKAKNHEWKP